ncbi:MAG: hypothetical protein DRG83_04640 [Deltaproteobacteria bacterium]|nr:MAG: hypothetical protein DRG83_04640 [Deltaproteobacteria bacterium]
MKARKDLINCLKKRDILNNNGIEDRVLIEYGSGFFEMELYNDAIDFFEKANYEDGLKSIKDLAIDAGDLFLYNRCCKALNIKEDKNELIKLAENAKEAGKLTFASQAYTELGDKEKAQALKTALTEDSEVVGQA